MKRGTLCLKPFLKISSVAKKEGNSGLSYVYKILMKSLYGRFGINPRSTITEITDFSRYQELMMLSSFQGADRALENSWLVSYDSETIEYFSHPRNAAVQISAAITAYARIYMHPYINKDDCYYTDTYSVVLGSPLP